MFHSELTLYLIGVQLENHVVTLHALILMSADEPSFHITDMKRKLSLSVTPEPNILLPIDAYTYVYVTSH